MKKSKTTISIAKLKINQCKKSQSNFELMKNTLYVKKLLLKGQMPVNFLA